MVIGIDIDDTISNTWEYMIPIYSELFKIPKENIKESLPYYNTVKNKMTVKEYFKAIRPIFNERGLNIPIRKNAKKVINNLHKSGHKIIIITAREEEYENPLEITQKYLRKKGIHYDKLIICKNKGEACINENVDLFIDDSEKHCQNVINHGVKTLMFTTIYNKFNNKFNHIDSWDDLEKYINTK